MIQARAVQSLADAHRRDLMAAAKPRRATGRDSVQVNDPRAALRSAADLPVSGGRAMAPRIGAWLIEFGTRLGGATVRPS